MLPRGFKDFPTIDWLWRHSKHLRSSTDLPVPPKGCMLNAALNIWFLIVYHSTIALPLKASWVNSWHTKQFFQQSFFLYRVHYTVYSTAACFFDNCFSIFERLFCTCALVISWYSLSFVCKDVIWQWEIWLCIFF